MSLDILYDGVFDNPSGLPKLEAGTGVPGWGYRWLTESLPGTDGSTLDVWVDENGRQTSQVDAAKRPALATVNSKRVLTLDGVNDYFSTSSVGAIPNKQKTIGIIARLDPAAVTSTTRALLGFSLTGQGATDGRMMYYGPTQKMRFDSTRTTAYGDSVDSILPGSWFVAMLAADSLNPRTLLNGTVGSITAGPLADDTSFDVLYFGLGGTYWFGQIAEVITWPTALTSEQMSTYYASSRDKYPTFNLP